MTQPTEAQADIVERLLDEADLCQNEGAEDIATLLSEAAAEITRLRAQLAEAELRGVKAGLEAALKALKTAQYDPAPYTKGSSAIRAIDPATLTAGEGDHG